MPESQSSAVEDVADNDVDMDDDPFIATPNSTRPTSPIDAEETDPTHATEDDPNPDPNPQPSSSQSTLERTFVPGASSTWPLWRVCQEVRHLLFEPLPNPKANGVLYAISSPEHNKVKIGYTMRKNPHERFRELERQYGEPLGHPWYLEGIPYVQLLRLEELVHADLAKYQCDLRVPFGRGNGVRVHREWFDVDLQTAERTVKFWWAAMQHLGIRPGKKLPEGVRDRLTTQGDMLDVKEQNVDGRFGDYRDHETTLKLWSQLLQLPRPGTKTWMDRWPDCWFLLRGGHLRRAPPEDDDTDRELDAQIE
ncbi:hypothetical protein PRZ48_009374 [Zasmidium cellare]|uniref:Bacteriophage T5 Orf172 DNA-binding domain-containing protein n=1 Tax=Zasmidium cellare TaxID=395010 RepID=A0ABR0EBI8_ZASCE|nr:hypothetical protein PRZ48_009374 [Zasmidium cellare]